MVVAFCVLPFSLLLAQSGQPDSESRPAIVAGRVIDAGTGHPVAGAIVMPFGTAAAQVPSRDASPAGPPRQVLTNAGGHFVIRGLHKGSLVLIATKGGYVDATYAQPRPGGHGQPIAIQPGQRLVDVDIRIWRHGVITGTVLDEAGEPVIAVRVQAFLGSHVAGRRRYAPSASATTDDRGVYRIAQLLPGDYLVAVPSKQTSVPTEVMDFFFAGGSTRAQRDELGREMKQIDAAVVPAGSRYATNVGGLTIPLEPGTATPTSQANGALSIYPTVFYPAASNAAQAAAVAVRSGEERATIDIQLHLEKSARVSGSLLAPDGMASHVPVRLQGAGNEALGANLDVAATITDAAGAFTFIGVPAGQYTLSVVRVPRPPVNPAESNRLTVQAGSVSLSTSAPSPPEALAPPPVPGDATLWAEVPLVVGASDVSDLIVSLRPGPRMSGRVDFDGTSQIPDPLAVANLRITLEAADGSPAARGLTIQTGHPDERGQFTTLGVPPGRYLVSVSGLPLPGWVFKGAQYEGRDLADTSIEMGTRDVSGVTLTFTDRPGQIEGTVRTGAAPDGDTVVLAYPTDADAWSTSGATPRRMRAARAASDGSYALPNLPAGDYYVVAVRDDVADWQDPAMLRSLARAAERVHLLDGERKSVNLRTVNAR